MFLVKILIFLTTIFNCEIEVLSAPVLSDEIDRNEIEFLNSDSEYNSAELGLAKTSRLVESRFSLGDKENELESDNTDYEQMEKYQGDILLTKDQENGFIMLRTGLKDERYRWPMNKDKKVVVPYTIANEYSKWTKKTKLSKITDFSFRLAHDEIIKIKSALKLIEDYTCVRFIERFDQEAYIQFRDLGGCYSFVGKIGKNQPVSLSRLGCMTRGTIQHEVVHALGYDHMQNHEDRDQCLYIDFSNIKPGNKRNFEKVGSLHTNFGTPYDYYSVMHYDPYSFAIDRSKPTIITKIQKFNKIIGQNKSMSSNDYRRINRMYQCSGVRFK